MANFPEPENPTFRGVRQIETGDYARGGAARIAGVVNSPMNESLEALVERTQWLKQEVEGIVIPVASTSVAGTVFLATEQETEDGANALKIVTPALVQGKIDDLPTQQTEAEVLSVIRGVNAQSNPSGNIRGTAEIATRAEALAGTDNTKMMTPLRMKELFESLLGEEPVWSSISNQSLSYNGSINLDLNNFVTGDPTPTITASGLPAGLSISNGIISGSSTSPGTYPITVTATNTAGSVDSSFNIIVAAFMARASASLDLVGGGSVTVQVKRAGAAPNGSTVSVTSGSSGTNWDIDANDPFMSFGNVCRIRVPPNLHDSILAPSVWAGFLNENSDFAMYFTASGVGGEGELGNGTYTFSGGVG